MQHISAYLFYTLSVSHFVYVGSGQKRTGEEPGTHLTRWEPGELQRNIHKPVKQVSRETDSSLQETDKDTSYDNLCLISVFEGFCI